MEITLSSYKKHHGLAEILSPNLDCFWHTDDNLPHYIKIQFSKLTYISSVQLYLSYNLDDSYTPEKIDIYSGLVREKIERIGVFDVVEPEGWFPMIVEQEVFYLYVVIRGNHQEGRDSHVRQLRILDQDKNELFYHPWD
ncbi:hypothetical protein EDEG_00455 [Edhazardia aedis USNM 41457]|uniref:DOC domain-containing protein n=1 Tax=Edhazardia aedis (strain USNM 41457) TaxID=1003232 RepID=J8ZNY7_EDHAE|nr:hypothetical protein EDEG_00455 [Edhazardia aedis USNM 41457]|eukprot:EJW01408.1 hypothetical protein EDEG_00455 [Edhazardia aedis USNM 41457]